MCSLQINICKGCVYVADVNPLGDNIDTIENDIGTLIDASKEVGLEVNIEKTKYMLDLRFSHR
jgi:hypothetical protein